VKHIAIAAAAALSLTVASAAAASVYAPGFGGPALDPTLSFNDHGSSAFTYFVGGGSLGLFKAAGTVAGESAVTTSFATARDFTATLKLYKSSLGAVGLELIAYDPVTSLGVDVFSDGPSQFQSYTGTTTPGGATPAFGAIYPLATVVTMSLTRHGDLFSTFVDGTPVSSGYFSPAHPLTFAITLCASTCISTPGSPMRSAFISDFSVTTADVPEPASWALLIAGFGLTGGVLRARRAGVAAAAA
jgi:hypothetical protein